MEDEVPRLAQIAELGANRGVIPDNTIVRLPQHGLGAIERSDGSTGSRFGAAERQSNPGRGLVGRLGPEDSPVI